MPIRYRGEQVSQVRYGGTNGITGRHTGENVHISESDISFSNFPGVVPNPTVFTGSPGLGISPAARVSWSINAPSGRAFQNAPTFSGVPAGFNLAHSATGSVGNTSLTFTKSYPGVYPVTSVDADFNDLTINAPTSAVNVARLTVNASNTSPGTTITGGGCSTFGSSCTGSISGTSATFNSTSTSISSGQSCARRRQQINRYSGAANRSNFGGTSDSFTLSAPGNHTINAVGGGTSDAAGWWNRVASSNGRGFNNSCGTGNTTCFEGTHTSTRTGTTSSFAGGNCFYQANFLLVCNQPPGSRTASFRYNFSGGPGGSCVVSHTF